MLKRPAWPVIVGLVFVTACEAPNPIETKQEAIEIARTHLQGTRYASGPFVVSRDKSYWRVSVPGPVAPGPAWVMINARTGKARAYTLEISVEPAPQQQ